MRKRAHSEDIGDRFPQAGVRLLLCDGQESWYKLSVVVRLHDLVEIALHQNSC